MTAWAKVMGASQNTSTPSRRNTSSGCTITVISRSPALPPFLPALPCPRREMVWPWSIPAGMVTLMVLRLRTRPCPPQSVQGWWMMRPVPRHFWQGRLLANTPMGVRCCTCTCPLPRQSGHISGVVPG